MLQAQIVSTQKFLTILFVISPFDILVIVLENRRNKYSYEMHGNVFNIEATKEDFEISFKFIFKGVFEHRKAWGKSQGLV